MLWQGLKDIVADAYKEHKWGHGSSLDKRQCTGPLGTEKRSRLIAAVAAAGNMNP